MAKKKKGLRNINPGDTVEFLNYITPDHIIRAKYNTGDNGMDITDVPQNLNSYIVLGGGSGVTVEPLSVTSNGLYTAPMGKAYTPVDVNVPVPPSVTVESLSVTSNGTYTAPTGKAYSPVDVNVPATPSVTVESLSVTSNGNYTAPAGKAYSPVDVNVPQTTIESLSVTINGTYNAPTGKAYDPVVVNVPQTTVESLSVTTNGIYTAPEGKAYSPVEVNVPSGITVKEMGERTKPTGPIDISNMNLKNYAFNYCTNITSVTGDNASMDQNTFDHCSGITSVNLTNIQYGSNNGSGAFAACTNLETAVIGYGTTNNAVGLSMFNGDSKLKTVDIIYINRLRNQMFYNCTLFDTLILRSSSLTPMENTNAFNGTPFASGQSGGTIYIPETLYNHLGDNSSDDYKAATNWSTIDSYGTITWAKIEGSIYE